jgi:multiple sugar transport system permease protein
MSALRRTVYVTSIVTLRAWVFAPIYLVARGGRNMTVLVGEAYVWQRDNQNYGVAAAYAVLIMAISLAATMVYLKALRVRPEQQP